jgi:hypothetical protein
MPARSGNTVLGSSGVIKTRRGRRRKKPTTAEVAGPYRSQSSVPSIRSKATKHEHRKEPSTVAGVERKARRQATAQKQTRTHQRKAARKARRIEDRALDILQKTPPAPTQAVQEAKLGIKPPQSKQWRKAFPGAAKRADEEFIKSVASKEGLKEDPLAEFVISTAATAGLGAAAKGAATLGKSALAARAGSELSSAGTTAASKVVETGIKAARSVKGGIKARAGARAKRIKTTPERIKTAPKRAKKAASTKQGRRAAGKGAARKARRHPVRTGYGAAAVSPVPLPGEADKRARAAAEGTFKAITEHPLETGETTLRSLPGAITAPAALAAAAGTSVLHGTPEPLVNTASEQAKGVAEIASNVFSGDPKKAEEAARKEGSLAFLTPLPAVSRLRPFKRGRRRVRQGAGKVRRKIAARGESANRSVRHSPRNVEQTVFAATGRRQARKKAALIKQRADNPQRVAAAHHERQITKRIAKAPKNSHVALQALAEYGIRSPAGARLVREKGPGDAQLTKALDYVEQHPEVFKSKDFHEALNAVAEASRTAPAAIVGKGERARLMQQGDVLGHTRPEHMVPPKAREFTSAKTREGAWADLASADKRLTELRRKGRERLDQAKVLKGKERERALAEGKALYAEARQLRAANQKLYDALDPFTRPGQSIDNSARTPYEGRMLEEYKAAVEASRSEAGLAPAIWTHHSEANTAGRGTGMENRFPTNAGRVEHMREGNLAKADNLDRSLEGLLKGTIHTPRLRAAGKQFGRDFVQEFKTPFTIDGKQKIVGQGSKDWTAITTPKTKENPNGGQFDPKSWARFPLREWKNAVKDPFTQDSRLIGLLEDAEQGVIKGSEPWILMPREAIREARAQISPEHNVITETANRTSRVASRTILGTNPAWAIAQIPAEGIPLLMAKPSLLNPVKLGSLERDIQRFKKTHPEEAIALQATAGASPINAAVNRTPLDMQETYTPALWDKGAKALTRGRTARSVISFAKLKALGTFDVKRQNEYRTLLAAAEADKRFRSWHSGLTGLVDSSAKISRRFKGKSRAELWEWLATDPKGKVELKKITDYVDNIQGNWTAFTRYERSLAPLAIFYPFLRYSLRWTLWTFPKTHPLTATLAYTLGQANANQLEKLTGGKLQNPVAYAFPAYQDEEGETAVLPGGSRISPGQSSLTQAIASANPAQVLSSANPFIGAGLTALTGIEPFTGEKASEGQGWAAINQLLSMPAPLRLAKVKIGEQSTASKAFEKFDPNKTERSILFPFIPQSGAKFRGAEQLGKAFDKKYSGPVPSLPPEVWAAAYGKDWKAARKLRELRIEAEKGGDQVRAAEAPFFEDSGELGKEGSEILQYITGQIVLPAEEKEEKGGSKYSGSSKYSSGNKYLEGNKYTEGNQYLGG